MEISGVSSAAVFRSSAFQPAESGTAASVSSSPGAVTPTAGPAADGTERSGGSGYTSPFLRYDQGARVAVLYFRDFDTGETQDQIPSQRVVEEYRRAASRLVREDEHGSAAGEQANQGSPGAGRTAGPAGGSDYRGTGPAAGSAAAGPAAASFAGIATAPGSGGSNGSSASTGIASAAGPAPAAGGGSAGGSPGGIVSVKV